MNKKVKQLLRDYADGQIEYSTLFSWLDGLLETKQIDREWYEILISIL